MLCGLQTLVTAAMGRKREGVCGRFWGKRFVYLPWLLETPVVFRCKKDAQSNGMNINFSCRL